MSLRVYTVHLPPARTQRWQPLDPLPELVKEGFSWPAFFFGVFWALWKRLWLVAALLLAVEAGLGVLLEELRLTEAATTLVFFTVALLVGLSGNDWRRAKLRRLGYQEVGVVTAEDSETALRRYLDQRGPVASQDTRVHGARSQAATGAATGPVAASPHMPWRGPDLPTGVGPWDGGWGKPGTGPRGTGPGGVGPRGVGE